MTTFSITPDAPYRISVSQPQVGGTPTPSISYAWSLSGVPIGSGRVINYTFDGDGLPATLRCVITLSNVAGSVSRTLEATIQAAVDLPVLDPITIRDAASPTTIIDSIANGTATLRVGGPTSADLNPTGSNFTSLAYQWRRGGAIIAGATASTYTLTANDNNSVISLEVTASNAGASTSRVATVVVGDALSNQVSHIGVNSSPNKYFTNSNPFANLWYSAVSNSDDIARYYDYASRRGLNLGLLADGATWSNWTGTDTLTPLGWPYQMASGANVANLSFLIAWETWRREILWDMLGLHGTTGDTIPNVVLSGESLRYGTSGIPHRVTFKLTAYWRGSGSVQVRFFGDETSSNSAVDTVNFTGPGNEGPWGTNNSDVAYNGPQVFNRRVATCTTTTGNLGIYCDIVSSSRTDPVRDIILLVSDVRNADTQELVFAGYDHANYKPFQIHLPYYERIKYCKVLRSLNHGDAIQHGGAGRNREFVDYNDTPTSVTLQLNPSYEPKVKTYRRVGWTHTHPSGMARGVGSLNHPGHILFGSSQRAFIELCNQVNADMWWNHPPTIAYAGTRTAGQPDTVAASLEDTGELLLDEAYIAGFCETVNEYLAPNLRVLTEYGNEVWNWGSSAFIDGFEWAVGMAIKTIASVDRGGDGGAVSALGGSRTLQAPALFAGSQLNFNWLGGGQIFQAAATAWIGKAMRQAMPGREVLSIHNTQSRNPAISSEALARLFACQPLVMRELDVIAHAPYESTNWNPNGGLLHGNQTKTAADLNLEALVDPNGDGVAETPNAAWDYLRDTKGVLAPAWAEAVGGTLAPSYPNAGFSAWVGAVNHYRGWKEIALDVPGNSNRRELPSGWDASKRRWNLRLMAYEWGNHYEAKRPNAKVFASQVLLDQRFKTFSRRYLEAAFVPHVAGTVKNASTSQETALFRAGMVPDGVLSGNVEPVHEVFVVLSLAGQPDYRNGAFWSQAYWLGHDDAPQMTMVLEAAATGFGEPLWWQTYTGSQL